MTKITDWVKGLQIPEARLTRPEEMKANPNHATSDPTSLVIDYRISHPLVPPMVAYHPALRKRIELEKLKRFLDQMLMTDANLHRSFLESARANDQALRIEKRRTAETTAADHHHETMIQGELDRRIFYFRRQLRRMLKQENLNADARKHMLELYDFLRSKTVERADTYTKDTRNAIREGERRHEEYWAFRLDNLWAATGTGGISKLENHGEMIGTVTGRIDGEKKVEITKDHWQWRKENVYITQPNGAITRADNGMGAKSEQVTAKIHQPLLDNRREAFSDWRASDSYVTTPNGSLVHMKDQGKQPESAFAWLSVPKKAEVTRAHSEERKWDLSGPTPNGGMAPLYNIGAAHEAMSANLYWPLRHDVTLKHTDWRKDNLWQSTPNGGYARLKSVGQSLERMTYEFDLPKRAAVTQYHDQKELNHRYVLMSNSSWGRLPEVGGHVEDIAGKVDAPKKDNIVEFFNQRDDNNLYTETENGSIARQPGRGDGIEKTVHDVLAPRDAKTMTSVKQYVHNEHDSSVDNGTGSPLAANGRQSEEAQSAAAQRNDMRKSHNFRELKKSLAAFEKTASAFAMHAVATPANTPAAAEPPASNNTVPAATSTGISKKAV